MNCCGGKRVGQPTGGAKNHPGATVGSCAVSSLVAPWHRKLRVATRQQKHKGTAPIGGQGRGHGERRLYREAGWEREGEVGGKALGPKPGIARPSDNRGPTMMGTPEAEPPFRDRQVSAACRVPRDHRSSNGDPLISIPLPNSLPPTTSRARQTSISCLRIRLSRS
jgi:hypothetical protein